MPYPIHRTALDKVRPAVVLTRGGVRTVRQMITVAPVTTTIRDLATEVRADETNGLDHESVILLDNVTTIPVSNVRELLGYTTPEQDRAIAQAIIEAFDLEARAI